MASRRTSTNIVRLPTAAPRRVSNCMTAPRRAARELLPQHPAEFLFPHERAARHNHEARAADFERATQLIAELLSLVGAK